MHIIKTVLILGLLLMWVCCTLTLGLLLKFNDTWEFECQANVNFGFKFFIHVFQIYFSLDVPNRTDLAGIFFFFYLCTFNKQSIRIIQSSQSLTRVVLLTSPTPAQCVVKLEDYGCQSVLYARLPDSILGSATQNIQLPLTIDSNEQWKNLYCKVSNLILDTLIYGLSLIAKRNGKKSI